MTLSAAAADLRSRFTPMPMNLHLGFCIFATAVFLIIYFRRKTASSLIWATICDATLILQFYNDSKTALAVGICEIVLFAILIWVSLGEYKERKRKKSAKENGPGPEGEDRDDLSDIDKIVKSEMQNISDGGSEDVIRNAFEDDKL